MQVLEKTKVVSVTELSKRIQLTVASSFSSVFVKGEISGYTKHSSGHQYFAIKDEGSVLDAICWRGTELSVPLKDGLEIIIHGRITTYPLRSRYQIVVQQVELAGAGNLQKLLKERFEHFKKLGYFDEHRKKALPPYPFTIGIVSSPTGAVIKDILHRIHDRFPCRVVLWPVLVQGEGADQQIANAIKGFHDNIKPDVIIVARGGGSIEDLWSFNEEPVIQAIYNATIPIISAIGHETDVTLADYVADKRAPTPTGAAEICVPVRQEVQGKIRDFESILCNSMYQKIQWYRDILDRAKLPTPTQTIEFKQQYLDDLFQQILGHIKNIFLTFMHNLGQLELVKPDINRHVQSLNLLWQKISFITNQYLEKQVSKINEFSVLLSELDIQRTLERGYCLARSKNGAVLSKELIQKEKEFELQFYDGKEKVKVL